MAQFAMQPRSGSVAKRSSSRTGQKKEKRQGSGTVTGETITFRYGDQPFGCKESEACAERFSTQLDLAKHNIKVHYSEYPYICVECYDRGSERRFQKKRELSLHTRTPEHMELCNKKNKQEIDKNFLANEDSKTVTVKISTEEETTGPILPAPSRLSKENITKERRNSYFGAKEHGQRRGSTIDKTEDTTLPPAADAELVSAEDITKLYVTVKSRMKGKKRK